MKTTITGVVVFLLAMSQCARAADMNWTPYYSLEHAAHDALVDAYNCGEQVRECGGVIYQRPMDPKIPYLLYFYSKPVTSNKPFGVDIPALAQPPLRGMKLVADYHNHICAGNHQAVGLFSVPDTLTNRGFHTVGYIVDGCTGNIHRFDPGQDKESDVTVHFANGRELDLTFGHITGWINVYLGVK